MSASDPSRLQRTLEAIDAYNAADPERVASRPKAQLHGQRMSMELAHLAPQASEALQLACRAQHIGRWELPRSDYPMDRTGYLQWRKEQARRHAITLGRLMQEHGYDAEDITRAQDLVQKKNLKTDDETATLEDCVCLVFLRFELHGFATAHSEDKVLDVLRKTWSKMSSRGHEAAQQITLTPRTAALVFKALR